MTLLAELGLTPAQIHEVEETDDDLVTMWLAATASARGLKSPAGYFLAGIRSGQSPTNDADARVRLARIRLRNLAHLFPTEDEALEEIFGQRGPLQHRAGDQVLRSEFAAIWHER